MCCQAMRAGPLNEQMREALEEARVKMGLEKEHADKVIAGLAHQQALSAVAVCPCKALPSCLSAYLACVGCAWPLLLRAYNKDHLSLFLACVFYGTGPIRNTDRLVCSALLSRPCEFEVELQQHSGSVLGWPARHVTQRQGGDLCASHLPVWLDCSSLCGCCLQACVA